MPTSRTVQQLIDTVPMPRSDPERFREWLREVARETGIDARTLGLRRDSLREGMQAVLDGTSTKGQRRQVYEAVLQELSGLAVVREQAPVIIPTKDITVYFTGDVGEHQGRCQDHIADAIRGAKTHVRMMSYCLWSSRISQALCAAAKQGKRVEVIADSRYAKGHQALEDEGVEVCIDTVHRKAHNKVLIIDEEVVFTGSFNFTETADNENAENLLELRGQSVVQQYLAYWKGTQRLLARAPETGYPPAKRGVVKSKGGDKMGRLKGRRHA